MSAPRPSDNSLATADDPLGALPAMALVGSTQMARRFALGLVVAFGVLAVGLLFLPWRQFVNGTGRVIAFDPLDRRINLEAQVSGRVRKLHVTEGQRVKSGDVIIEIQDNDPQLLSNLRLQREAIASRRSFASNRVDDLSVQIAQQELALQQALDVARQRVAATKIAAETAALNFERSRTLEAKGLVSRRDFELATRDRTSTAADQAGAEATLRRTENDFQATLAGLRAQRASAQGEVAAAERDLAGIEIAISQNLRQVVEAPRDGIVLTVTVTDGTYLRPGSPICTIIPETDSRYVELWLDGNDVPLVRPRAQTNGVTIPGSPVRLQFEGWPAIQIVGWPGVAVGTFGGEVVFIDATDNGKGRFRIVVAAQPDMKERAGRQEPITWPSNRWLRQGVRANGWVMLEQVPLWREIWRQLNGFPPVVADGEPDKFKK
jgi:multidrug resistance efflux pump